MISAVTTSPARTFFRTDAALAAQQIRSILKRDFPSIKFSVRSETYSGGDSITVCFPKGYDGDTTRQEIEAKIKQFKLGHFDGMTDSYEDSNRNDDIPQVKFLFVDRY